MKNIKLFENFDSRYLWPEAKFWIDKLEPEELFFLGVYSYMLEKDKKQPLFETEYDGTNEAEPDEDGDGGLEMSFTFPVAKAEYSPSLTCELTFSGDYLPYDPGDYNNAPEGGGYVLNNIDIESISKKFKINIVSVEVYPVRYFNEVVWKEQLQYIIDAETDNNLSTNDSYFYRCITVKKNKFDEYITVVAYGTKMAICHRPAYSEN